MILSETDRLSSMVEELLDFSRMQSGRLKLVKTKIDLLAELGEAVMMYTERAKREGIALIYDEPDVMAPVFGDKTGCGRCLSTSSTTPSNIPTKGIR